MEFWITMKIFTFFILISILFLQACDNKKHTYQGYIAGTNTYISSQFEGKLKKLLVEKGDKVDKGTLLFVLDDKPQSFVLNETKALLNQSVAQLKDLQKPKRIQSLNIIRAKIKQVEAQINLAQLRENRNQILFNKKVLAKDSLDGSHEHLNELLQKKKQLESELELSMLGARTDVISAKMSSIKSLQIKIKNLTWVESSKKSYSPDKGVVFDTYFVKDEFVTKARPVVALLFPKNVYLEFFVPYIEAKNLHVGDEVEYSYVAGSEFKSAKIIFISPEAEYVPPLVYSRDNMDKIVFKVKAKPAIVEKLSIGIPVTIRIDANHA